MRYKLSYILGENLNISKQVFNSKAVLNNFIEVGKENNLEVVKLEEIKQANKAYGYCRVSTKGQIDNNSLEQQKEEIKNRYYNAICYEEGYTGKTTQRPIFNELLGKLEIGDTLVVTKLDRLCRSTKEGLEIIDKLKSGGVKIHILNMGLIEDTPVGNLIITNLLAFSEFERAMIIERTQTGKAIAKTKSGFKEGRPKKFTKKELDHALSLLNINGGDKSYKDVEELLHISKSTLIREMNKRNLINKI